MTPRTLIAALAVALAAVASSCTTFTDSSNVARVDDETLSADELSDLMAVFLGPESIASLGNADGARGAIQYWLNGEIAKASLEETGTDVPTEQADAVRAQLATVQTFIDAPAATQDTIIEVESTLSVFLQSPTVNDDFVATAAAADVYVDPRYGAFVPPPAGVGPLDVATVVALQ
ncbi:MAG: hypothetical protein AAGA42_12820 [Actinomycetota bacterium]